MGGAVFLTVHSPGVWSELKLHSAWLQDGRWRSPSSGFLISNEQRKPHTPSLRHAELHAAELDVEI